MKKKRIVLISVIILVLVAVCLLYFFINDDKKVSYIKKKVSLDNIKPNETVFVKRVVRYTCHSHENYVLIINKNKQIKYVDLSARIGRKELSLCDYDAILQDKKIAFSKTKLKISNGMLGIIININDYKLKTKRRSGRDLGSYTYYSVCGSGKNRMMVIMKKEGSDDSRGKNQKINKLCDDMDEFMSEISEEYYKVTKKWSSAKLLK